MSPIREVLGSNATDTVSNLGQVCSPQLASGYIGCDIVLVYDFVLCFTEIRRVRFPAVTEMMMFQVRERDDGETSSGGGRTSTATETAL